MRRAGRLIGTVALVMVGTATAADAATLTGHATGRQPTLSSSHLEQIRVTVDRDVARDVPDASATQLVFSVQPGSSGPSSFNLVPRGDCTVVYGTPTRGFCPIQGQTSVWIELSSTLRDGLVRAHATDLRFLIFGGKGDDRLDGGWADDQIGGSFGNDWIDGDRGDDALRGEAGRDTVVDLFGDNQMSGGSRDDLLLEGSGASQVSGDDGNDRIIDAGGAGDRLIGGLHDDTIRSRDRQVDTIVCGSGRDVAVVDARDRVMGDCESVVRART